LLSAAPAATKWSTPDARCKARSGQRSRQQIAVVDGEADLAADAGADERAEAERPGEPNWPFEERNIAHGQTGRHDVS
jgi:hypothetical protein